MIFFNLANANEYYSFEHNMHNYVLLANHVRPQPTRYDTHRNIHR